MLNLYPYTDFHELNLDMILRMMKDLHKEWTDFEAVNKITNAGAWNITKQYQAWTVVSDNNIGYISLKPVPAGVAITNIEYWGVIADYNILITDLSNRISVLEGQMNNVNNYITNQTTRNIVFIGDSFGTLPNSDGKNMFELAAEYIGCANYYIKSVSSKGFATTPGFIDQLADLYTNTIPDANAITDIVVCGGPNDGQFNPNDIVNAIKTFCTYAKSHFPYAKIYIGCEGASRIRTTRYVDRLKVVPCYREGCKFGAQYLYGLEYALIPAYQQADGLHPTYSGVDVLGHHIADAFLNGKTNVRYLFEITSADFTLDTTNCNSFSFNSTSPFCLGIDGDGAYIGTDMLGAININMGGKNWRDGTEYHIGDISLDKMPFLPYDGKTQFQGNWTYGGYYHGDNAYGHGWLKFRIFENGVYITPYFDGFNIAQASGSIDFTVPNISFPAYLG